MILWALTRSLGHLSSTALCSTQLVLYVPAGSIPLLLLFLVVILWYWRLQNGGVSCPAGSTFTNSLSWALFKDSSFATQWQASAALYDPLMPSKPVPPGWHLNYQVQLLAWSKSSGTQLVCADSEEILPRCYHLSEADLFLNHSWFSAPADQHPLSQQRFNLSGFGVLLITANSSAPA